MKLNIEKASTPRVSSRRLGEVLELMQLLWAVTLGITGPQRLVIRIVGQCPGISAGMLADILCVHPSTLTGVLRRLELRKILYRKQDPEDGRRALLSLTDKGRALDNLRSGTVEAAVRRGLLKIPPRKIEHARDVLRILATELQSGT